jgi:hypothetical protein
MEGGNTGGQRSDGWMIRMKNVMEDGGRRQWNYKFTTKLTRIIIRVNPFDPCPNIYNLQPPTHNIQLNQLFSL